MKNCFTILALCSLAAPVRAQGPESDPTFKVDVSLVHVLATVKGPNGEPIGDLQKEDFTIVDAGEEREIVVFERQTNRPLSVALMLDTSLSTAKEIRFEKDSAKRFAANLFETDRNGKDRLGVFKFSVYVQLSADFTRSRKNIAKALDSVRPDSGTSMYDAIALAAGELERRSGRRVMVIITDGGDTTSSTKFHAALEKAQRIDAVIYGIIVMPIQSDAGRNVGGENALKTLAAHTGGATFVQHAAVDLDQAFDEILRSLRTQYLLAYYPPEQANTEERFRPVSVTVNRPDARVLARNGYYVPEQAARSKTPARISLRPSREPAGGTIETRQPDADRRKSNKP